MPVLQCHLVVTTGVATAQANRYKTSREKQVSALFHYSQSFKDMWRKKYCFQKKNCVQWGLSFVPPGAPLRQPFFPRVSSRRPSKVYPSDPSLLVMQTGLSSTNPELRFAGFLLIPQCSLALSHSLCSLCHCLLGLSFRGHWKPCTAFWRLSL